MPAVSSTEVRIVMCSPGVAPSPWLLAGRVAGIELPEIVMSKFLSHQLKANQAPLQPASGLIGRGEARSLEVGCRERPAHDRRYWRALASAASEPGHL